MISEFDAEAAVTEHGGIRPAARALGIPVSTMQGRLATQRRKAAKGISTAPEVPPEFRPGPGFEITENSVRFKGDGTVTGRTVKTQRMAGDEYAVPADHVVKGESALIDPNGRLIAKWIKTREGSGSGLVEALQQTFAEYKGASIVPASFEPTDDELLTIYPIPDLHLGMYAWGRETGNIYNIDHAVKMATDGVGQLVGQSRPSKRAVVLGLGDYFHSNDAKAATPHSGHLLDVDGRWPKVYRAGAELATVMVDLVGQKHDQVDVVMLPGNHDPDAAATLAVALSMFYANNDRIHVDLSPSIVWYLRFGAVMLGATHGHTMKPDKMAMAMATDRPQDWGETAYRHFFFGHIHHESAIENGAVRIESFSSPAARDAWNSAAGYRSGRAFSAITFHRDKGEIGRHRVNIITKRREDGKIVE